jgi:hypothetical protein
MVGSARSDTVGFRGSFALLLADGRSLAPGDDEANGQGWTGSTRIGWRNGSAHFFHLCDGFRGRQWIVSQMRQGFERLLESGPLALMLACP